MYCTVLVCRKFQDATTVIIVCFTLKVVIWQVHLPALVQYVNARASKITFVLGITQVDAYSTHRYSIYLYVCAIQSNALQNQPALTGI